MDETKIIKKLAGGTEISGFSLKKKIGEGGMGEVWLANQPSMDRQVAIKVLHSDLIGDKTFLDRFLKEVKLSAKLNHSNIVTAYDGGEFEGIYFLALEFVDGVELRDKIVEGKLCEEKEGLQIIKDIALALEYAWDDFKILHRDIKPSNIMIDKKGNAKLMDMGISKSTDEDISLTMTGCMVGTPYYMSPEQARASNDIDFRADVYSLGATFYDIITGKHPYEGDSAMAILTQHINDELVPVNKVNSKISENTSVLINKMMAKNAEDRHSTWRALIEDIDLILSGEKPNIKMNKKSKGINPIIISIILGVVVIFILAIVVLFGPEKVNKKEWTENVKIRKISTPVATSAEINANPAEIIANPAEIIANPAEIIANPAEIIANPAETNANPAEINANPAETNATSAEINANPAETNANHAKKKVITKLKIINSVSTSGDAKLAYDDNLETFWKSNHKKEQNIVFDLGKISYVENIKLYWNRTTYPKQYNILISKNNQEFINIKEILEGKGGTFDLDIKQDAQYLKFEFIAPSMFDYSLPEIEIKGY